ncbi:hypothetical protein [Hydrogenophaga sp.]|uniref:hypothetical protein n=1 Tax=Hydrogenophaga sp. TaxID=1904254 RepID=UPI002726D922|nr:hypothetical protein [Hydrogenophaga sp.]MDO9131961.1 hypothetical protein [Hydrogenophaga sp.]
MIYFKTPSGEVFAYETAAQRDQFGQPDLIAMTPADIAAHLAPPPVGVPQTVTRFQALAALHLANKLTAVQAIMAAPETPMLAKLAWDNALSFERTSPTLASLAAMLGMTDADLDALFTQAATIEA